MSIKEFVDRTGFEPTFSEYEIIENEYYMFSGDKNDFCNNWLNHGGIQRLERMRVQKIEELQKKISLQRQEFEIKIKKLEADLEKEQEWKPCKGGTNVFQQDYEKLLNCPDTRELSEDEAKDIIYREFGFAPEKVIIISEADSYESNRHHLMRKAQNYIRIPVYNASDWNYIRFNCAYWMYEYVNGSLCSYDC